MTNDTISHFMTFAQLESFRAKLHKQTQIHEKLISLSCEMYKALYQHQPNSALIKSWHDAARELMGG